MSTEKGHFPGANYEQQGGKDWTVEGTLDIISATGKIMVDGVDKTAALASGSGLLNAIAGVAASYKIARGEVTLDGSNPTPIVTGLTTVVAFVAMFKRTTAAGVDPTDLTCDYGGAVTAGSVNLYAWKPTAVDDCTLIASTNSSAVASWIAIGT